MRESVLLESFLSEKYHDMLTILYGPSCVGKTTLIKHLINDYHWKPISCYLTRPLRVGDVGRIPVTKEEFEKLEKENFFHCVNHHFEASYGTPKNELVDSAQSHADRFVLDFMLKNYLQLEPFEHKKIIILPESIENLKLQIDGSDRSNRYESILKDIEENYSEEKLTFYKDNGFKILVTRYNDIAATLNDFMEIYI
jgi:guanylate kinase